MWWKAKLMVYDLSFSKTKNYKWFFYFLWLDSYNDVSIENTEEASIRLQSSWHNRLLKKFKINNESLIIEFIYGWKIRRNILRSHPHQIPNWFVKRTLNSQTDNSYSTFSFSFSFAWLEKKVQHLE